MNAYAVFDAASFFEPDNVQGRSACISCQERSSLHGVVADLLYKNQLLRFKLSQSQALVGQLRLAFDQVQADPSSATELQGALNGLSTLLKPELEC
jgi:hypothetical protein